MKGGGTGAIHPAIEAVETVDRHAKDVVASRADLLGGGIDLAIEFGEESLNREGKYDGVEARTAVFPELGVSPDKVVGDVVHGLGGEALAGWFLTHIIK